VDDNSSENLRGQGAHCRKLANAVSGEGARTQLLEMANDFERRAAKLDMAKIPQPPTSGS
jgi:hypothetical protein